MRTVIIFVILFFNVGFAQSKDVTNEVKKIFESPDIIKSATEVAYAFISPTNILHVIMKFKDETNYYYAFPEYRTIMKRVIRFSYVDPFFSSAKIIIEKFPSIIEYQMLWEPFYDRDRVLDPNSFAGMAMRRETIISTDWKYVKTTLTNAFINETKKDFKEAFEYRILGNEGFLERPGTVAYSRQTAELEKKQFNTSEDKKIVKSMLKAIDGVLQLLDRCKGTDETPFHININKIADQ